MPCFIGLVLLFVSTLRGVAEELSAADLSLKNQLRDWSAEVAPFRIAGNIYYVGWSNISSFLITSSSGHILLDTGMPGSAPSILKHARELGFEPRSIKIILNSHAHLDHAGSHAAMKHLTG